MKTLIDKLDNKPVAFFDNDNALQIFEMAKEQYKVSMEWFHYSENAEDSQSKVRYIRFSNEANASCGSFIRVLNEVFDMPIKKIHV